MTGFGHAIQQGFNGSSSIAASADGSSSAISTAAGTPVAASMAWGPNGSLYACWQPAAFTHGRFEGGKIQPLHLFRRGDFPQRRLNLLGALYPLRALLPTPGAGT